MCRAPEAPGPARAVPVRTLVQLYAACFVEVALVAFLAFYAPPKDYNTCATAVFALGTTTVDLVLLAAVRCGAYLVIAHRTIPSKKAADAWAGRLSHASLLQLTYGIVKGVSRALGARADCHSNTEIFDGCCAAFAVFASVGPMFLERRLRATPMKRTGLAEPLLTEEEEEPKTSKVSTVRAIISIARPDAHLFWLAMVFAVLAALATSAVSLWTGDALDALIAHGDGRKFKQYILQLMLISIAGAVCTGCRGGIFSWIGVRINVRIRDKLFRHLVGLELSYYDVTPTGDLNSRLASDTSKVGDQVSLNVNVFARTGVQLVTTLAFMISTSPPLSLVACCAVPVIGIATKRYGALVWALSKQMQNELAGAMRVAEEAFSSMLTVRSMAAEPIVCADFADALQKYMRVGRLQALLYACWQSFNTALPNLMTCLLLYYGGHIVDKGELRSGRLVSFMLLTQSLSDSFNTLADMYSSIADALGAADKVFELLERKPAADAPPAPLRMDADDDAPCRGDVCFEDVAFTYPARPDTEVLRGVSFRAAPGEVLALVGPSGSGKSSALALLQNFYSPSRGRVLLDGQPVMARSHAWLHKRIAMVGQEPVLFARSIAANVAYGLRTPPSDEKVAQCLRAANASFIDEFADKADTEVGERGAALSGGQKQRIAIARALARDPAVLCLDEATSALDAESERCVQDALDRLIESMKITVLVVAHRLSTVRDADRICVMKKGLLVEEGTHDDLFERDGVYADLVRRQTGLARSDSQSLLSQKSSSASLGGLG